MIETIARGRAFEHERSRIHRVLIEDDGSILVWDAIAGHYTRRHQLRSSAVLRIQHDASGVGHCWRDIDAADIPADIREEICAEIIDGRKSSCRCYVATNGLHYRW